MISLSPDVYQDGESFYRYCPISGDYVDIATYRGVVKSDRDTIGARIARIFFASEHPEFVCIHVT